MKSRKQIVVVQVQGGVVQEVFVRGNARVFVADYDNLEAGDKQFVNEMSPVSLGLWVDKAGKNQLNKQLKG